MQLRRVAKRAIPKRRSERTAGGRPKDGTAQKHVQSHIDVSRSSIWLRGRHHKADLPPVGGRGQRFAGHQFDGRPILTKEACCIVIIACLHSNTAGLPAGAVRYLKVKIEADCFQIFSARLIVAAHLVSPPFCVAHFRFLIWIFVRRDCGALERATIRAGRVGQLARVFLVRAQS
jgi:hypothetical protein